MVNDYGYWISDISFILHISNNVLSSTYLNKGKGCG